MAQKRGKAINALTHFHLCGHFFLPYSLFAENGPFSVAADGKTLVMRDTAWSTKYNVMFIDNPYGINQTHKFGTVMDEMIGQRT